MSWGRPGSHGQTTLLPARPPAAGSPSPNARGGVMAVVAVAALAFYSCGGGGSDPGSEVSSDTTVSTVVPDPTDTSGDPGTTRATAAPGRRPRPLPGPPSTAFFQEPGDWYEKLKDLNPASCASLVQDITSLMNDEGRALAGADLATAYVFRAAGRGCANDLTGSRADLTCAQAARNLLSRDRAMVELLDWALDTYGPARGRCSKPATTTTTTTSTQADESP